MTSPWDSLVPDTFASVLSGLALGLAFTVGWGWVTSTREILLRQVDRVSDLCERIRRALDDQAKAVLHSAFTRQAEGPPTTGSIHFFIEHVAVRLADTTSIVGGSYTAIGTTASLFASDVVDDAAMSYIHDCTAALEILNAISAVEGNDANATGRYWIQSGQLSMTAETLRLEMLRKAGFFPILMLPVRRIRSAWRRRTGRPPASEPAADGERR